MRGIVRGMDAAPEAHMDVFTAFPRMNPEAESRPRSGALVRGASATGAQARSYSSASTSATLARRIGLPSTGLDGACRMPSSGNTTASTVCRPATKRSAG